MSGGLLGHRVTGKQGEPLVLLNGALMSLAAWQPVVNRLERDFRVVRCDFRGQMFSPGGPQPDRAAHRADVLALLDHLGLGRVHLAGASFGSIVALELAAMLPERVASVAAVTSTERIAEEAWEQLEGIRLACLAAAADGSGDARGRVFDLGLPMFSPGYQATHGEDLRLQREWLGALPESWFRGVAGVLESVGRLDLTPLLPRVRCPALVVAAGEDRIFPVARSQALAAALPAARLVVLPGAGHNVAIEQPGPLAEALRQFCLRTG